jgi:hypothetical protein
VALKKGIVSVFQHLKFTLNAMEIESLFDNLRKKVNGDPYPIILKLAEQTDTARFGLTPSHLQELTECGYWRIEKVAIQNPMLPMDKDSFHKLTGKQKSNAVIRPDLNFTNAELNQLLRKESENEDFWLAVCERKDFLPDEDNIQRGLHFRNVNKFIEFIVYLNGKPQKSKVVSVFVEKLPEWKAQYERLSLQNFFNPDEQTTKKQHKTL